MIDAHLHLWAHPRPSPAGRASTRLWADVPAVARATLDGALVVQVGSDPDGARALLAHAAQIPCPVGVVVTPSPRVLARPVRLSAYVAALRRAAGGRHLAGIRLNGRARPDDHFATAPVRECLHALGQVGLPAHLLVEAHQLPDLARTLGETEVSVAIDHLGGLTATTDMAVWSAGMRALAQHSSAVVKVSGAALDQHQPSSDEGESILSAIRALGASRTCPGSDWPYSCDDRTYLTRVADAVRWIRLATDASTDAVIGENTAFTGLLPRPVPGRWAVGVTS